MVGDEDGCVCVCVCVGGVFLLAEGKKMREREHVRSYSTTLLNLNFLHNSHSFIFTRKYF